MLLDKFWHKHYVGLTKFSKTLVDIEDGKIISSEVIDTNGRGHEALAGVQGDADEAAQALAEGRLEYDPDAKCDHHGHEEGHECGHGDHECGHGNCHK